MDDQQLRPIPGFEKYLINSDGGIFSLHASKFLKPKLTRNGQYVGITLLESSQPKVYKNFAVHRLVASIFISNPENKPEVNHIDGNKLNPKLNNLEWVTKSENMQHSLRTGLSSCKGATHHNATLTESQVHEICSLILNTDLFYKEIAKRYNVSVSTINNIAQKHRWVEVSDTYWTGKVHRLSNRNRDSRGTK